jgi:hypothetical protein
MMSRARLQLEEPDGLPLVSRITQYQTCRLVKKTYNLTPCRPGHHRVPGGGLLETLSEFAALRES